MFHPFLTAAALLATKYFGGASRNSGGSDPINYMIYAVEPGNLRGFMASHPDAMSAEDFLAEVKASRHSAHADSIYGKLRAMQRQHPECVIIVADIRS